MSEYLKREDVRRAVLHNEGDAVIAAIDELPVIYLPEEFQPIVIMKPGISFSCCMDEVCKAFAEELMLIERKDAEELMLLGRKDAEVPMLLDRKDIERL